MTKPKWTFRLHADGGCWTCIWNLSIQQISVVCFKLGCGPGVSWWNWKGEWRPMVFLIGMLHLHLTSSEILFTSATVVLPFSGALSSPLVGDTEAAEEAVQEGAADWMPKWARAASRRRRTESWRRDKMRNPEKRKWNEKGEMNKEGKGYIGKSYQSQELALPWGSLYAAAKQVITELAQVAL